MTTYSNHTECPYNKDWEMSIKNSKGIFCGTYHYVDPTNLEIEDILSTVIPKIQKWPVPINLNNINLSIPDCRYWIKDCKVVKDLVYALIRQIWEKDNNEIRSIIEQYRK